MSKTKKPCAPALKQACRRRVRQAFHPVIPRGVGLALCLSIGTMVPQTPTRADFPIGSPAVPQVEVHANPDQFKVYSNHPRLFFRDTDLPAIRNRIAGAHQEQWQRMADHLEKLLKQDPAKFARHPYLKSWSSGRNMAFAAVVTGDARYREWALRWADALASADTKLDATDDDYRGRLMSLAVAYDWLFPWHSDSRTNAMRQAILVHIERNWFYAEKPNFISGHSRWGNFSLMAGLLAVITERPEFQEKLMRVRRNWLFGYHPAQGWIAADGGYHMAWTYSARYADARNHCVWSSATNENVYYPWREHLPYFFLYGDQGDGTYPNSGDAYSQHGGLEEGDDSVAIAAGIFKNRHAAWMIKPTWNCFYELLYADARVRPLAPDDPDSPLPLARRFNPSGVVVMRDRWDDRTTHLAFKSSSFYSANHHHRDENAFTVSYRGPLAIDSGYYDRYGSKHWRNYFTRTIAHNAVTVFDPAQKFLMDGKPVSNDGGQVFGNEPTALADIQPGGHASLDGILRYEHCDAFTYALGSATRAYDSSRVRLAEREIVYLRPADSPHPVIVIFDRVDSVRADFEKAFILHAASRPSVEQNRCVIDNGGGRLTCFTLWPEKADLRVVGGPGNEFLVDGANYPPEKLTDARKTVAGAWRLEVIPTKQRTADCFLHVLLVEDIETPAAEPRSVSPIHGEHCVGVEIPGWAVVFPLQREQASQLSYHFTGRASRHLVAGCPIRQGVRATVADESPLRCTAGEGGVAVFDLPQRLEGKMRIEFPR